MVEAGTNQPKVFSCGDEVVIEYFHTVHTYFNITLEEAEVIVRGMTEAIASAREFRNNCEEGKRVGPEAEFDSSGRFQAVVERVFQESDPEKRAAILEVINEALAPGSPQDIRMEVLRQFRERWEKLVPSECYKA